MESRAAVVEPPINWTNMIRARMMPAQIIRLFIQLLEPGSLSEPPFCGVRLSSAMSLAICLSFRGAYTPAPASAQAGGGEGRLLQRLDRTEGAGYNLGRRG